MIRAMAKKPPAPKRPKRKRPKPLPRCKAILLCERTIREETTRNVSIIGVFTHFHLPRFPGQTRPFTAFVQLVNGIGEYNVVVEIHDLQLDLVLARAEGDSKLTFPDRLVGINIIIPLPGLPLSHPGKYDFVVIADGREIERQQFTAVGPPEQKS